MWPDDLIVLAAWALQSEDLRHRFIHAASPSDLLTTPGLTDAFETAAVLAIYEAARHKGYVYNKTILYECPYYPDASGIGPRSDLGFKATGPGQNWALVEAKYYSAAGIQADVAKLRTIERRVQRWMLVYRVIALPDPSAAKRGRPIESLENLMGQWATWGEPRTRSFATIASSGNPGQCEVFLGRLL